MDNGNAGVCTQADKYVGFMAATLGGHRTLTELRVALGTFFPVVNLDDTTHHFDIDALRKGIKSTQYTTTPYEGDPQVRGKSVMYNQWWNVSPRVGLAWDIRDGHFLRFRWNIYDYPFTIRPVSGTANASGWY